MEKFDKQAIDEKVRHAMPFEHRWHNRFHLEMPFGLINDPNGLAYYNGEYHIFYQWNPLGCVHKNKCWAHVRTRDFVTYSMPELALWPTDVHDKDGCYSGCGLVENGQLRVLYTCNSKDEQGVRTAAQRFGTWMENGSVRKDAIIVPGNPEGFTAHFRDPNVFYHHGVRHFVLGAQRENETGTVLVYREEADGWKLLGELKTEYSDFGYMWECPGLLKFGSHDVLLFCPQGLEAQEYQYQNVYQSGYIAGHVSLDSMEMIHGKFQELDRGFDFYAPQVFQHEGRQILLGWMGMPDRDEDYPTAEKGWVFSLTMPRVLTLRQGHIFSRPARELQELRIQESAVDIEAQETDCVRANLAEGGEVLLNITLGKAQVIHMTLGYGMEKTVLHYDHKQQIMTIDRTGMNLGGKGKRSFKLYVDQTLSIQLFIDRTAIEVFFQNGEEAASFFVFPEKNILPELVVTSDEAMEEVSGRVWELAAFRFR
ncbi:MAG: glycoside hydrolase family 32 protein [Selenomonadaceae bacterium]|nr:glycoside hydrolase family 32 protein [Selenomonadaceae bacterium]